MLTLLESIILYLKFHGIIFKGVSTLLESLAFALGDPGDVFVINFPVYARFGSDLSERAQIKLMGPTLRASNDFQLRYSFFQTNFFLISSKNFHIL